MFFTLHEETWLHSILFPTWFLTSNIFFNRNVFDYHSSVTLDTASGLLKAWMAGNRLAVIWKSLSAWLEVKATHLKVPLHLCHSKIAYRRKIKLKVRLFFPSSQLMRSIIGSSSCSLGIMLCAGTEDVWQKHLIAFGKICLPWQSVFEWS